MSVVGLYAIPVIILLILAAGFYKKVKVFSVFCAGAKEGLRTVLAITPTLIGLVVAVELFKRSGALDILTSALSPLTNFLGFPGDLVPLALIRPISGSGSVTLLDSILADAGPDSFVGRVASVMSGASETTFYAATMYFGSIGIKNIRHTLLCALSADVVTVVMSVLTVGLLLM